MSASLGIPASQIVAVTPNVLSAGGTALNLNGLILTTSTRPPIGTVQSFPSGAAVGAYFGLTSNEYALAQIYFNGFDNSNKKPGALLFAQYPWAGPVGAFTRGGPMLHSVADVNGFTGYLTVTIDGVVKTNTITGLAYATSYSTAAYYIQTSLGIFGPTTASATGYMGGTCVGTGSGTNLTVASVSAGSIYSGDTITGTGIPASTTIVSQTSGTTGGAGVYVTSGATTASSATITVVSSVMVVTAVASGSIGVGNTGLDGELITAQLSGTPGGIGSYSMFGGQQTIAPAPFTCDAPACYYDPATNAFVIQSATTGPTSTISYVTGSLALAFGLAQANGAVLSQGAAQATPAAFMPTITAITTNWASFMTTFLPNSADKIAFALWTNAQGNDYLYAMWDQDILNTESGGGSPTVQAITAAAYSGTAMIYENPNVETNGQIAAFLMGTIASIDFTETDGNVNPTYKHQSGLTPQVTSYTAAAYLQSYKVNFYGSWNTANDNFTGLAFGNVSGLFLWIQDYVNQIWMTNQFQLALMVLMFQIKSIPYDRAGYVQIEEACQDVINQAFNFGAIQKGVTLSASQIAQVNASAGFNVATTIQQRGWYLLVQDSNPQVRAARGSPPCTFWYTSGESIQQINLASVLVQ